MEQQPSLSAITGIVSAARRFLHRDQCPRIRHCYASCSRRLECHRLSRA
ncbi:Uncharacterised protein [Vibrio cholerae]|nr:Uncharacterised protein [Vibrio cholerae]CSI29226.1 Uncharacterised protein [Vibrio cholerae]CSI77842.1 Uncharacterised protein [Vibrio cholerae]